ncbi:MAG: IclR family transcriptional regulator [Ferruginibacter sp.]|nr:IclR family transcriptional regulator [Ferruginibacter sp.]
MIQVIGRALDIIEFVAKHPGEVKPLGVIADEVGLNHGTCANILKTLVNRNYIEKVDGKKGYRLGMMAFKLSGTRDYKNDLIEAARAEMEMLTKKFNENTLLSVLHKNNRLAILRINSNNQVQVITPTEKEAFNSSTGRLLMALLSKEDLDTFVATYGLPKEKSSRTISRTKFIADLADIRKKGYATHLPDDEILGIAVPIYQQQKAVASLSIYLPAFRSTEAKIRLMLKQLLLSAETISQQLS